MLSSQKCKFAARQATIHAISQAADRVSAGFAALRLKIPTGDGSNARVAFDETRWE
jgi:hypothetical protein